MPWKIIARRTRFNDKMRANLEFRLEENQNGETRKRVFIVCADGTFRPLEKTGYEGALDAACAQVAVNLVPVLEPRVPGHLIGGYLIGATGKTQNTDLAGLTSEQRAAREKALRADPAVALALDKIHAMQEGRSITFHKGEKGVKIYDEIGCEQAARRYGRRTTDVCERIPGRSGG